MVFVGWVRCVPTGPTTCQITVNGPQSVRAVFGSPLQYYHLDVLGSVRMITNAGAARERPGAAGPHKRARLAECRGPRQPRNDQAPRPRASYLGSNFLPAFRLSKLRIAFQTMP
jgi:hypothetical protein